MTAAPALIASLALNILLLLRARPKSKRDIRDFGNGIIVPDPDDYRWKFEKHLFPGYKGDGYRLGEVGVSTENGLWSAYGVVHVTGQQSWSGLHAVRYRDAVHHAYIARKALEAIQS